MDEHTQQATGYSRSVGTAGGHRVVSLTRDGWPRERLAGIEYPDLLRGASTDEMAPRSRHQASFVSYSRARGARLMTCAADSVSGGAGCVWP